MNKFSAILYGLHWAFKYTAWKHEFFRDRLKEKNLTVQIRGTLMDLAGFGGCGRFGWTWLDLGGFGHLCRFGWSCPDSLRLDLKRILLHFDLSGCRQDLFDFVGFVWIWAGFERIPLDLS